MSSVWVTLGVVLVPILLPRFLAFVRSIRISPGPNNRVRPLKPLEAFSISLLFIVAVLAIISTLPMFYPENIIELTDSRLLQTPNGVIQQRLVKYRQSQGFNLTQEDDLLLEQLKSKEGRLLYATYGPKPLLECIWCKVEDASGFLIYSLPGIVAIHLLHTCVLGLVTSRLLFVDGNAWRTHGIVAGIALAIAEVVMLYSHDIYANTRVFDPKKVVYFHWTLQFYRGIGIAIVDTLFGALLHLSATRRLGAAVTDEERIEESLKSAESTVGLIRAGVFFKNATMGDQPLREKAMEFWKRKETERAVIMGDEDVRTAVKNQYSRLDVDTFVKEAEAFTDSMMSSMLIELNHLPVPSSAPATEAAN